MDVGEKSCRRSTPVGRSPARGANIASKSAVSSSGIILASPAGLVGYDTSRAAMLKGQTFGERAFRHLRGRLKPLMLPWCGANPWTAPPVRSNLQVGGFLR